MGITFVDSFEFELLLQWFQNAPTESFEYAEVILYDPESKTKIYHASPLETETVFSLNRVSQWEEDPDGTIIPTVVDEIEQFSTLNDLCLSIVRIAHKEKLLPQLGLFTDLGEDIT